MTRYHVNPETGNVGKCSAKKRCRFGDIERDHYSTREEARRDFEKTMVEVPLKLSEPSISRAPKPYPSPWNSDASWLLTYEVKYVYDHPYEEIETGVCDCRVVNEVEIRDWNGGPESVVDLAKATLNLPPEEPFPKELLQGLQPFMDEPFDPELFEPIIVKEEFGEELESIQPARGLKKVLDDYYYSQANAAGPENVLSYLRGKGYVTAGKRPLEALKSFLREENGGELHPKVAEAKKWKKDLLPVSLISAPKREGLKTSTFHQEQEGLWDESKDSIVGVVLDWSDGSYELVEGHNRLEWYRKKHYRNQSARYLILSPEEYQKPFRSGDPENKWYGE